MANCFIEASVVQQITIDLRMVVLLDKGDSRVCSVGYISVGDVAFPSSYLCGSRYSPRSLR